jgi:heptosyltransferase-2
LTLKELNSKIRCLPWRSAKPPKKILAIRFQALGDVVITLPYLQSLKKSVPGATLHLLTRSEVSDIPEKLAIFDHVIRIGGGRNAKLQFVLTIFLLPYLWWQRYEVVLDLQNHKISRMVRRMLFPACWSEFDRTSKIPAGERTRQTIKATRLCDIRIEPVVIQKNKSDVSGLLVENGWDGKNPFVILNPSGAFITRNWPIKNYLSFAEQWIEKVDPQSFFVLMGLTAMTAKASMFRSELKEKFIDLTGKTTPFQAFCIIRNASLVLSEDSGLMHMAWVQSAPTLALFGSSPDYWSAPLGEWSRCLSSSDLPCGNCFSPNCQFGDVHCLTRYTAEFVLEQARVLVSKA